MLYRGQPLDATFLPCYTYSMIINHIHFRLYNINSHHLIMLC